MSLFSGESHFRETDIHGSKNYRTNFTSMQSEFTGEAWNENMWGVPEFWGCEPYDPNGDTSPIYRHKTFDPDYSIFQNWTNSVDYGRYATC